jgi:hypothetical protein
MEDQAVTWVNVQEELVSVAAIRADEREKCRAELREKIRDLNDTCKTDRAWIGGLIRWARGREAFGGE